MSKTHSEYLLAALNAFADRGPDVQDLADDAWRHAQALIAELYAERTAREKAEKEHDALEHDAVVALSIWHFETTESVRSRGISNMEISDMAQVAQDKLCELAQRAEKAEDRAEKAEERAKRANAMAAALAAELYCVTGDCRAECEITGSCAAEVAFEEIRAEREAKP